MLDATIQSQVAMYMQKLTVPIQLTASLSTGSSSADMSSLLSQLCSSSPLVQRGVDVAHPRTPSFGISRVGETPRVRFAGLPLGHEFTSLILAMLQTGGHPPKVTDSQLAQIKKLKGPLDFEVFISLSCHNCPDVVQALNLLAVVNPNVTATTIDGALFQDEVERLGVMAVPAVFLNGKPFASGRMSLEELLAKLDTDTVAVEAAALMQQAPFDVLVVGGGPAGAAAAVYASRKGIRTGVLADRLGGQTNDTLAIENYISVKETTGPKFSTDLEAHVRQYGVEVMKAQRAVRIVPAPEAGDLAEVHTESGAVLRTRSVVVSTGARWRSLDVPGEAEYRNKGVAYCPHCDGPLFKGKRVAVVGGGNSGVEAAIDLAGLVAHVTLLEYGPQLKADAVLVDKLRSLPNATILTHAQTTEVSGDGSRVSALQYVDRVSGTLHALPVEGVFVQIGLTPNTEFLRGVLELNAQGEIVVDARGQTSAKGIFAAGDATTTPFKQIIVAAGEGAKAALSAFDHLIRTPVLAPAHT